MNFCVDDPTLIRDIQRLIDEFNRKKADAERIASTSYEERLGQYIEYINRYDKTKTIGFTHWYKKYNSYCTCPPDIFALFFKKGEPIPCAMRGSLLLMRDKYKTRSGMAIEVLKRFIKRKKITCTSREDWQKLLESKHGIEVYERIKNKWDMSQAGHGFYDFAHSLVTSRDDVGGNVLINGKQDYFSVDQVVVLKTLLKNLNKMDSLERKLHDLIVQ